MILKNKINPRIVILFSIIFILFSIFANFEPIGKASTKCAFGSDQEGWVNLTLNPFFWPSFYIVKFQIENTNHFRDYIGLIFLSIIYWILLSITFTLVINKGWVKYKSKKNSNIEKE